MSEKIMICLIEKKQFACCSNKKLVGTTKNSQKYIGEEEDGDEAASGDE